MYGTVPGVNIRSPMKSSLYSLWRLPFTCKRMSVIARLKVRNI